MGSIPPSTLPVLIVGAGPVGLALALDLGRRGVRTTIVERGPPTGTGELLAKASVINERTMEFCRLQGIRDEVAHSGFPEDLPGDTVFCTGFGPGGKLIGQLPMPSAETRELPEQCCEMLQRCPQFLFDPIFAKAVARQGMTDVRYGVELLKCEEDTTGVTCFLKKRSQTKDHEQVRAQYVVACDGAGSVVRKALGIPFEGKDLGYTLSVIVKVDLAKYHTFPAGERYLFIGPESTWANFTTLDGRLLWRFTVVGSGQKLPDPAAFDMHAVLRRALGRDDAEYELMRVLQWRRSQFTAARYHSGGKSPARIFLAGDAAHTMSPTGGHGLNTGIGDISDLSWMLAAQLAGWGGPRLADAYEAERRPIALRNGAGSTKNFALWTDRVGRDKLLEDTPEGAAQRKALGERMAGNMRQEFQALGLALGYSYAGAGSFAAGAAVAGSHPGVSLIVPDGSGAPPDEPDVYVQTARPGHRAPHVWLEDGRSTLDLFGGDFVLLRLGDDSDDVGDGYERVVMAAKKVGMPVEVVRIDNKKVAELYERRLVLVRPDGMVAWRGDVVPEDVERIVDVVRGA
ncbi:FAD binding domain-containing protein [Dichotomopilus funicola]|uniref:FAD binding domain-containing protein n=1 Tax=Dichotomopilus funicola TaxID=1934379 RepID=A0AAN6ZRS5_9PEZI|nr:FAD binding domain-containing protein [Dichotomopilus funicola]